MELLRRSDLPSWLSKKFGSAATLAEALNVTRQTAHNLLTGRTLPSYENCEKLGLEPAFLPVQEGALNSMTTVVKETPIPEWMRLRQEQRKAEDARRHEQLQRQMASFRLMEAKAPRFFQDLLRSLKLAVDYLPALNLVGSFSPLGLQAVRISVNQPDAYPNMTYTDLFLDEKSIRCTTLDAGFCNLRFALISDNEIGVIDEHKPGDPMNPQTASEYIMTRMVDLLERRRRG